MKKMDKYNAINWSDYVYYDETSPSFLRWKVDRRGGKVGQILVKAAGEDAGSSVGNYGYFQMGLFGVRYLNHRVIWVLFHGSIDPEMQIDHKDGNRGNNSIDNLRLVTSDINSRNQSVHCNNTTGATGVSRMSTNKGRYHYYIAHWNAFNGKQKQKCFSILKLGELEAFRLACEYRQQIIGELNSQGAGYTERHGD